MQPLRKDEAIRKEEAMHEQGVRNREEGMRNEEKLTTADLVADRKPAGPQLVERQQQQARDEAERAPLFPQNELHDLRSRWDKIQAGFVDEPRQAVQQADSLVASAIKRLAEQFANERSQLENQWGRGDNVSTEDLRQALRRYRSFFDRLLSA